MDTKLCYKCGKKFKCSIYVDGKRVQRRRKTAACYECVPYTPCLESKPPKKCEKCKEDFFPVIYWEGKRKWLRTRRFCFDCQPYQPRNKTNASVTSSWWKTKNTADGKRECRICKQLKELSEFSPTNKYGNLNSYCKECSAQKNRKPRQRFKEECVAYKGGQCVRCGYKKCPAALEFHHRDPSEKDFQISKFDSVLMTDVVKTELDKCDLVCSNCHKEIHYEKCC